MNTQELLKVKLKAISDKNIKDINNLVCSGFILPNDDAIVDKYLDVYDINKYRIYVNNLKDNNYDLYEKIEFKRKREYDNIISYKSDNFLLREYDDLISILNKDNILTDEYINNIKLESDEKFLMILIDRYFDDVPYNFMRNLEMIIIFNNSIDKNIISYDRLNIYMKIYNFYYLSYEEKVSLYNELNNRNNYELFYDDYRKCKNYAYSMINDNLTDIKSINKSLLYDDLDVYELSGENFMAIVHQTEVLRNSKNKFPIWNDKVSLDKDTISFSLIDQNHMETIYYNDYVVLGFSNIDIDRIIHVYHADSYTSGINGSKRVNEIYTPYDFLSKTNSYNEILYLEDSDKLFPSYILCYDEITKFEKECSKIYNIPIVLIHTDKYIKRINKVTGYEEDNYYELGDKNKKMLIKKK